MAYDELLRKVADTADQVVRSDESDGDPESAHAAQDALVELVLEAIAKYTTDERSRALAAQALRPFQTEGTRWFA